MLIQPQNWTPFASEQARLNYLKEHKLTPRTFKAPKPLFYNGIGAEGNQPCTAEGFVDEYTMVIRLGERYHCIHPDYLLEMQTKKNVSTHRSAASVKKMQSLEDSEDCNAIDFVAIDFETATSNLNSACALGIAVVKNLEIVETWYHLIQPPKNYYDESTVRIHGITPAQTENQPTLDELWSSISKFIKPNCLLLAHNARFDTSVLRNSMKNPYDIPNFRYADTLTMVKPIVPGRHGLDACCDFFGIALGNHHNALDDAIACANIAICCANAVGCNTFQDFVKHTALQTTDFHQRPKRPNPFASKSVKLSEINATVEQFDFTHPLYQKNVVFTGDLSIERAEAVQLAVNKGAVVKSGVSGKTHIVVIGTQGQAPDAPMSGKEKRTHELIASGNEIRIMYENEFLELVR